MSQQDKESAAQGRISRQSGAVLNSEERIQILLIEYKSLRTDMLQLVAARARLLSVGVPALVGLATVGVFHHTMLVLVSFFLFL